MKIEMIRPVGEIAVEFPQSILVFKEKGIDYCCGGQRTLQEACQSAGVMVSEVVKSLEGIEPAQGPDLSVQWNSLHDLIAHILKKHHVFTKSQLNLLVELSAKVFRVHGANHAELDAVDKLVRTMAEELGHHMAKEEQIAFPYLVSLEEVAQGKRSQDLLFSYEVFKSQPQHCLTTEHEETGEQLRQLRKITGGFEPPAGACVSYRAFYRALKELEEDIHQHIHLENNVLFPMAERLAGVGSAR